MYGSALLLVLASAASLLIGLVRGDARPVVVSLVAAAGALVLLWAGVARASGGTKRDLQG